MKVTKRLYIFDLVWANLFENVPNNPDRYDRQKQQHETEKD